MSNDLHRDSLYTTRQTSQALHFLEKLSSLNCMQVLECKRARFDSDVHVAVRGEQKEGSWMWEVPARYTVTGGRSGTEATLSGKQYTARPRP